MVKGMVARVVVQKEDIIFPKAALWFYNKESDDANTREAEKRRSLSSPNRAKKNATNGFCEKWSGRACFAFARFCWELICDGCTLTVFNNALLFFVLRQKKYFALFFTHWSNEQSRQKRRRNTRRLPLLYNAIIMWFSGA